MAWLAFMPPRQLCGIWHRELSDLALGIIKSLELGALLRLAAPLPPNQPA
jgi:hypothetical protein